MPVVLAAFLLAAGPTAADRGKSALEGTAFIRGFWPTAAYRNVWKQWGETAKPADLNAAVAERYGLHPAPYPNDGYPMGLRKAGLLLGTGVGIDCMTCHGGNIFGKSMVGLGNTSLDIHALFEDLGRASGTGSPPFAFSQARGTSEAGAFSVYLLGLRKPDLSLASAPADLGLRDDSVEDVPAWWLLKKKRTMYHTGATDARSVRSIMQFLMHPLTTRGEFDAAEPRFRDVLQYLLSIESPKYPYPVDAPLAATGKTIFADTCAKCHGTYGDAPTYPNKVIPLADIGTDPKRFENIGEKFGHAYNASWFAQEEPAGKPVTATAGYQAPPLHGVWATAPYFHNGSVPTLDGVLNSAARPRVFTRSFRTGEADYDRERVGWRVTDLSPPGPTASGFERRKVYDTTQPGRGNAGHTYGDHLTAEERRAVVEYLKTL